MIWLIKDYVDDSILRIEIFKLEQRAYWSYYHEKEATAFPGKLLYVEVLFNDDQRKKVCADYGWAYLGEVK